MCEPLKDSIGNDLSQFVGPLILNQLLQPFMSQSQLSCSAKFLTCLIHDMPSSKMSFQVRKLEGKEDCSKVTPEEVLEKALLMVQNSQKNYLYKCDQLKSIHQDLTAKNSKSTNSKGLFQNLSFFPLCKHLLIFDSYMLTCQSQLQSLYAEGIEGCHMEFVAYNLLCVILHSSNNRDLVSSMSRLSSESKRDNAVRHALAVRAAVTSGNYVMFFRLFKTAPNLNTCLMGEF
ncbi:SAC3 family protein A-like [Humulus lupulus]|uniref:SAC3 family protein A-like n=1 Tax=Humulus lupulus TaxID=3486 RepID=UPI002B412711|nr:SAC3 family protein A-like [Humulus lupulus]